MRRSLLLISAVAVVLVLSGCAGSTSTSVPSSTSGTTAGQSSSTSSTAPVTSATTAVTSTTLAPTSTTRPGPSAQGKTYTAELTGKDVVPAVGTDATGLATFVVDPSGTRVRFSLTVNKLADATASRVRQGKPGSNGSGVLILFAGPTRSGPLNGTLVSGSFDASALIGSLRGKTIADFVSLLESGDAYISVGTEKNPDGEIRGQIHPGVASTG